MMSKSNLVPLFRGCLINILTRPNFNGTLMKRVNYSDINLFYFWGDLLKVDILYDVVVRGALHTLVNVNSMNSQRNRLARNLTLTSLSPN